MESVFKTMWQKRTTVIIVTIFIFLLTIAITLTQPLKYSVTTRLLVVQNYNSEPDAYAVGKANQYLSSVLAQVVYSDAFYDSVMNSGFNINPSYFPTDNVKRREFWQDTIDSKAIGDTGTIEIVVYHQDKAFADQLSRAIAYILQTQNNEYHGLGNKIRVKVLDNSIVSVWPVKPNLLINSAFGILLGLILSAVYLKLWPHKEIVFTKQDARTVSVPKFDTVNRGMPERREFVRQTFERTETALRPAAPRPAAATGQAAKPEPESVEARKVEAPDNLPFSEPKNQQQQQPQQPPKQENKFTSGNIANIMR